MPFQATFKYGEYRTKDHTPSGSAVAAGDIVVVGVTPMICHRAIADGQLGALAVAGGAYEVLKGAGVAIGDGALVYWDDTNNVANTTASGNTRLGRAVKAALAGDATVWVFHDPA